MNLYTKYLDRAERAFARRDAQRTTPLANPVAQPMLTLLTAEWQRPTPDDAPDPVARGWMREINERLNRMHVNASGAAVGFTAWKQPTADTAHKLVGVVGSTGTEAGR